MEARARRFAAIAIAGCAFFLLILIAFHFIQPELDPLKRFGSEYAAGRLGWLMNVGFVSFAAGLASLAIAFGHSLQPPARSRGAGVLLGLSSLGILGSGLFNSDLQGTQPVSVSMILHSLSGFLAFGTMIPAMILLSRRLHVAKPRRGIRPVLRYFPWLVLLLFLAMLFVFEPLHLVGLGQRLFLAAMFTWLLSAAHAVRSGTVALLDETRGAEKERLRNHSENPSTGGPASGRGTAEGADDTEPLQGSDAHEEEELKGSRRGPQPLNP